ncbi:MAG: 50S ribosomal protein L31 [Patescibacteria group bacterium]|nr:50S ribosomal protein L31 [Patescibacteria group bacterium]MDE2438556.1 50S ribosomal protein L31 [Patescibacteria group bacterium]
MKKDIHPPYHQAKVSCACGNTFTVGSTKPEIHTEICSKCHPYYIGKDRTLDIAGRVERFKERAAKAAKKTKKKQ